MAEFDEPPPDAPLAADPIQPQAPVEPERDAPPPAPLQLQRPWSGVTMAAVALCLIGLVAALVAGEVQPQASGLSELAARVEPGRAYAWLSEFQRDHPHRQRGSLANRQAPPFIAQSLQAAGAYAVRQEVFEALDLVGRSLPLRRRLSHEDAARVAHAHRFQLLAGGRTPGTEDRTHHYGRGTPGDWRTHLQEHHLARIDATWPGLVTRWGQLSTVGLDGS